MFKYFFLNLDKRQLTGNNVVDKVHINKLLLRQIIDSSREAMFLIESNSGKIVHKNVVANALTVSINSQNEVQVQNIIGTSKWNDLLSVINKSVGFSKELSIPVQTEALGNIKSFEGNISFVDDAQILLTIYDANQNLKSEYVAQSLESVDARHREKSTKADSGLEAETEDGGKVDPLLINGLKFKYYFEQSPESIVLFDGNGSIILWNKQSETCFGSDAETVLGKPIWEVDASHGLNLVKEGNAKIKSLKDQVDYLSENIRKKQFTFEAEKVIGGGKKKYYEMIVFPIHMQEGILYGRIANDITEKRKGELELMNYKINLEKLVEERTVELETEKIKAEESDRLKTAFLANISHEIRTPMNGILGFTKLLEEPNLNTEDRNKYLQIVQQSTRQLLHVINDIIDASRIQSGYVRFQEKECSLRQILLNAVENQKSALKVNKKISFHIDTDDEDVLEQTVITDPEILQQILNQLIANAIKFTSEGEISVGIITKNGQKLNGTQEMFTYYVKDSGIGIPKEKQRLIFQHFRQVDDSATREFGGVGIGLTICKGLIELSGSEIWVESAENQGSTFYFTLPSKLKHRVPKPIEPIFNAETLNWSDKHFLVVEDDNLNYIYLREILGKYNPKLTWVKNGADAIVEAKEKNYDLVLMDIHLPRTNGYEATKEIRLTKPHLPIIAQTANAMSEDSKKCFEAGCDDYIAKPIAREELLEKIFNQLNRKGEGENT